ncbi:MAG: polymerase sigma factor, sigma-70 family [Bacteroidetes bacterium]|nr:polymerase sigma factor, sigma-70 family [Bacteroidota bacterium]
MIGSEKRNSYDLLTDEQLIQCIIQNDEYAIEYFFYNKCHKMFSRIIWQVFSSKVEMDELIDEFYIYLQENNWSKLRGFVGDSALMTWLTVVAVRFFVKNKQQMTNTGKIHTLNFDEVGSELDKMGVFNFESILRKKELYIAINKIKNARYRWVLLAELNGQIPEEMAIDLKTNVGNIYNLKKRAKIELAELLNEWKNG